MRTRPLCMVCLFFLLIQSLLLIFASGNSLFEVPASSIFKEEEGKVVYVQGEVYQKSYTSNLQILYLKNNSVQDSKLLIYDKHFTDVPIGKTIYLKGMIGHFERARNPGNFDQAIYYARQGFYGVIWCEEILQITGETDFLLNTLHEVKMKWKEQLIEIMGEKNGAVLAAMLLGEKREMDVEVKELYQKNGISHVLAISGLHISFIGLGMYRLIRKTGMPYWLSGVIAVSFLSLYVFMIGFSVSVVRAYVMLLLRIGADMTGRVYDAPTALGLSASLTVLYEPLYLTDAGFYMSYGAILGIFCVLPALKKCVCLQAHSLTGRWLSKLFAGGGTSLAVNLTLFPIMLWNYYEFSTYSIVLNMVVVPLMSILLALGMMGSFFVAWLKPFGSICLKICSLILDFFEGISLTGSKLPFARIVCGQPDYWKIILYYILLIMVVVFLNKCRKPEILKKSRRYVCLLFLGAIFFVTYRSNQDLQITMLDVGQGDGIFIRGPEGTTYFIDGGSSDVEQLGKYRIEPYLKSQGVGELDYVFITHGDTDHYSGIEEMIGRQTIGVKINHLVLPANYRQDDALIELAISAQNEGIRVVSIHAGQRLCEANLQITCIQPSEHSSLSGNEGLTGNAGSMVLQIEYGEFSMLCTGDVEGEGEELLANYINGKQFDVLKVAHHGSKNSTSEAFLKKIQVSIALISAGGNNSYGHPHAETIERLQKEGCKVYQTKNLGAITLLIDGISLTISLLPYRL